jgi:hypothetical protein
VGLMDMLRQGGPASQQKKEAFAAGCLVRGSTSPPHPLYRATGPPPTDRLGSGARNNDEPGVDSLQDRGARLGDVDEGSCYGAATPGRAIRRGELSRVLLPPSRRAASEARGRVR